MSCDQPSGANHPLHLFAIRTLKRLAVAAILLFAAPRAGAVGVSLSPGVVGLTPEIVGYNSGHFMPGSNTADWWRYSGVNGARVWATPSTVEGNDDLAPWGDGVGSEQQFLARRAALRANPLSTTYINWPYIENRYDTNPTTGSNTINLKYAFGALRQLGIDPLVVINRTNSVNAADPTGNSWDPISTTSGWADRWEQWQHFYTQAFYLARHFDVHRFQMYNEPNLDTDLTVTEYLERLRFASDAVQSAVADVNAMFGKSLDPQMQGPVMAGGTSVYPNWGAPVVQSLHTDFRGVVDADFQVIDTFAYQQYNATGATFGNTLQSIKNSATADAGGSPLRFAITEFNVHTASTFATLAETLDTPSKSARFGSILANLANRQPNELYIFKFSQTDNGGDGDVKKNGTHYVDNNSAPYDVGDITKGGEVVRLFAKGFAGANQLMTAPIATGSGASDLSLTASLNDSSGKYFLLSANEAAAARTLSINLSLWGIEPGTRIIVEEVSADRHGEVSQLITVPATRMLDLSQPAQSVLLFTVPKQASAHQVALSASDDAMVKAGSNAGANFGTSPNLFSKNEPLNPAARNVTFIKFNTGSIVTSEVEQAILQVYGENTGSASQVITSVYGLADDQWSDATITWNNAPNLADTTTTALDDISENFIEGIGESAQIVGHFTGIAASRTLALDVTDFVRNHPDQEVTFLVARVVRYDGENVDDDLTSLRLASKERGTAPGPQLLLSLSALALAGDYDHNGAVDMADYAIWHRTVGETVDLAADGNRDGIVDAADYAVWRRSLGTSLPGNTSAVALTSTVLPEPAGAVLLCLGLLAFSVRPRSR